MDATRFSPFACPNFRRESAASRAYLRPGAFPPTVKGGAHRCRPTDPPDRARVSEVGELFPLRYRSVVPTEGVLPEGELHGFMFQSLGSDEIVTRT